MNRDQLTEALTGILRSKPTGGFRIDDLRHMLEFRDTLPGLRQVRRALESMLASGVAKYSKKTGWSANNQTT